MQYNPCLRDSALRLMTFIGYKLRPKLRFIIIHSKLGGKGYAGFSVDYETF
jgi:hypothetical protein